MKQLRHEFKHLLALAVLLIAGTVSTWASDEYITRGDQSGDLPLVGMQAGSFQKCEFVVPASYLEKIKGKSIESLKFPIAHTSMRAYFGNCVVFMKEVDFTTFSLQSGFTGYDDATIIYEGGLDATGEYMEIPIEESYSYNAGNLLIGIYITSLTTEGPDGELIAAGGSVRFQGSETDEVTGLVCYNKYLQNVELNTWEVKFLPTLIMDVEVVNHKVEGNEDYGTMAFTVGGETVTDAAEEAEVTLTVTADEGYVVANVGKEGSQPTDLTLSGNGPFTFTMPNVNVYVDCDWLRDIGYAVEAQGPKVVEWTGSPLDPDFKLVDVIDAQNPKDLTKGTDYTVAYKKKSDNSPVDPLVDVGEYIAVVTGIGDYTGTFNLEFTVQKKIEIALKAHYMGTYFFDNAIETFATDEGNAAMELGTVTAVSAAGKATVTKLTDTKISKQYPFLVYNNSNEPQTFTLWEAVSDVTASNPTPAAQFTGTAAAKDFTAAETAAKDYYVLQNIETGDVEVSNEFVYVIGAGTKKANRCWIELTKSGSSARILTITMDEATGISEVKSAIAADGCYDMQGRKMTTMPTQRGLYVIDGRKVIVK